MNAREQAIELMARAIQSTPIYRDADAYRETDYRKLASWALDALLAATQEEPCPTCEGDWQGARRRDVNGRWLVCEDCTEGRVPGAPLVILGPELVAWFKHLDTGAIVARVHLNAGEVLYRAPEPQVHNANEEPAE